MKPHAPPPPSERAVPGGVPVAVRHSQLNDAMSDTPTPSLPELRCSSKGCTAAAVYAVKWNNPRLHPPERRKTWLACAAHRDSLASFLAARGFWRETEPLPPR